MGGLISLLAVGVWWTEPRKAARWLGLFGIVALLSGYGELHRAVMPKEAQQSNAEVSQAEQQSLNGSAGAGRGNRDGACRCVGAGASGVARGVRGSGLRILGVCVLVAVMIQGLLGGLRVKLDALVGPELAMIHGIFAQIVFGLLVAIAVLTARLPTAKVSRQLSRWSLVLAAIMFGQVVLGASDPAWPDPADPAASLPHGVPRDGSRGVAATRVGRGLGRSYAGFVRGVGAGGSNRTSACARRRGMDGEVWDVYPSRSSHNHAVERSDSNRARASRNSCIGDDGWSGDSTSTAGCRQDQYTRIS